MYTHAENILMTLSVSNAIEYIILYDYIKKKFLPCFNIRSVYISSFSSMFRVMLYETLVQTLK